MLCFFKKIFKYFIRVDENIELNLFKNYVQVLIDDTIVGYFKHVFCDINPSISEYGNYNNTWGKSIVGPCKVDVKLINGEIIRGSVFAKSIYMNEKMNIYFRNIYDAYDVLITDSIIKDIDGFGVEFGLEEDLMDISKGNILVDGVDIEATKCYLRRV